MTTELTASYNNIQPPKRLLGTPSKVERCWSHKILQDIHQDLENSSRQPASHHRSPSPTASKQPQQLQPLWKRWGSKLRPRQRLPAVGEVKGGPGSATEPPRHPDLTSPTLPAPWCLGSRDFHIFVDPLSPAGDSNCSGSEHWPPRNAHRINLLLKFKQEDAVPPLSTNIVRAPPLNHKLTHLTTIGREGDVFCVMRQDARTLVDNTITVCLSS
jgi:hypothetical protein